LIGMKSKNISGDAKSPHYDWTNDPKKYIENGMVPMGRCYHCGSKYNNPDKYSAFCGPCLQEMKIGHMERWEEMLITSRNRIEDDDKPATFTTGQGKSI